eukprot:gene16544-biopygen2066
MIVGGCGEGVPEGYYPDLSNCHSYCKCTGTIAPARYETCQHGLLWDTHAQGNNEYLPGNWGKQGGNGLHGTNGGVCNYADASLGAPITVEGKQRPGCELAAVADLMIDMSGEHTWRGVCSPTAQATEPEPATSAGGGGACLPASQCKDNAACQTSWCSAAHHRANCPSLCCAEASKACGACCGGGAADECWELTDRGAAQTVTLS